MRLQVINGCPRLGLHKGDLLKVVDDNPQHTGGGTYIRYPGVMDA